MHGEIIKKLDEADALLREQLQKAEEASDGYNRQIVLAEVRDMIQRAITRLIKGR